MAWAKPDNIERTVIIRMVRLCLLATDKARQLDKAAVADRGADSGVRLTALWMPIQILLASPKLCGLTFFRCRVSSTGRNPVRTVCPTRIVVPIMIGVPFPGSRYNGLCALLALGGVAIATVRSLVKVMYRLCTAAPVASFHGSPRRKTPIVPRKEYARTEYPNPDLQQDEQPQERRQENQRQACCRAGQPRSHSAPACSPWCRRALYRCRSSADPPP